MTAEQALRRVLISCQPGFVAVCGSTAREVGQAWAEASMENELLDLPAEAPNDSFPLPGKPDLALITEALENLSHADGELLLGQLRNYGTHQIAVIIDDDSHWHFRDFIGLGFFRQGAVEGPREATLFTYNIDRYNHKRAWNNPDNWANPEMWGKAWW